MLRIYLNDYGTWQEKIEEEAEEHAHEIRKQEQKGRAKKYAAAQRKVARGLGTLATVHGGPGNSPGQGEHGEIGD